MKMGEGQGTAETYSPGQPIHGDQGHEGYGSAKPPARCGTSGRRCGRGPAGVCLECHPRDGHPGGGDPGGRGSEAGDRTPTLDHRRASGCGSADQRHHARSAAAIEGRSESAHCGREPHERGNVHSLARPADAGAHGWCARNQFSGYSTTQHLRLRIPHRPGRYLLVPLAHRIPGARGSLRSHHHRPEGNRSNRLRPRACGDALGLQLHAACARAAQTQAGRWGIQLPAPDGRWACRGQGPDVPRAARLGANAHGSHGYFRCHGRRAHVPGQRARSRGQLDGSVQAGRARSPSLHQCRRADDLQRPHSRIEAHHRCGRWPACAARRSGRIPDRQCRDLRCDRSAHG